MKITTKTGDRGDTGLFGGRRVSKASTFIELVGQLDELQSYVGWARCAITDDELLRILDRIQDDLYRMMAVVGFGMKCPKHIREIDEEDVTFLEKYIIEWQDLVKNLSKFINPGSCEAAARLHIVRTVCRRVERRMVKAEVEGEMLKYLNRLSDFLFILAYKFEKK